MLHLQLAAGQYIFSQVEEFEALARQDLVDNLTYLGQHTYSGHNKQNKMRDCPNLGAPAQICHYEGRLLVFRSGRCRRMGSSRE